MASISSLRAGNGVRGPHTRVIWKGSDSKAPTRRVHCRQSVADVGAFKGPAHQRFPSRQRSHIAMTCSAPEDATHALGCFYC